MPPRSMQLHSDVKTVVNLVRCPLTQKSDEEQLKDARAQQKFSHLFHILSFSCCHLSITIQTEL